MNDDGLNEKKKKRAVVLNASWRVGKSYGSISWLGFWSSGLFMYRMAAPGEEDLHQSQCTGLPGGLPRKFYHTHTHTYPTLVCL
jgi:hypothetical protein